MAARARRMSVMRLRCGWLVGTFEEGLAWAAMTAAQVVGTPAPMVGVVMEVGAVAAAVAVVEVLVLVGLLVVVLLLAAARVILLCVRQQWKGGGGRPVKGGRHQGIWKQLQRNSGLARSWSEGLATWRLCSAGRTGRGRGSDMSICEVQGSA